MKSPGVHLYGLIAMVLGVCTIVWPAFVWQMVPPAHLAQMGTVVLVIGIVELLAGIAVQSPRFGRAGAAALAIIFGLYTVLWLPPWLRHPLVFDDLGNAFEQFAMCCGALMLLGRGAARIGYYGFALSVLSFAIYQAIHLRFTAELVPKWITPGQMFWSVATTIAFALAALALFVHRPAQLGARLTALMLAVFGLLIWLPAVVAKPRSQGSWSELGITFGICGAAWIIADYVGRSRSTRRR